MTACDTSHGSICALSVKTSMPSQPASSLQRAMLSSSRRAVCGSESADGGQVEKIFSSLCDGVAGMAVLHSRRLARAMQATRPLCRYCRICASRAWSAWTMSCAARDEVAAADPPRRASRPDELPSGASDSARWMLERHRYVWDRGNELRDQCRKRLYSCGPGRPPDDGTDERSAAGDCRFRR